MVTPNKQKLLVADADSSVSALLMEYLTQEGYDVDICDDRNTVMTAALEEDYGVILLDYDLNIGSEPYVLESLRTKNIASSIVMLTSSPLVDSVIAAFREGAFDVIVKPFTLYELNEIIDRGLRRYRSNKIWYMILQNLDKIKTVIDCDGLELEKELLVETSSACSGDGITANVSTL